MLDSVNRTEIAQTMHYRLHHSRRVLLWRSEKNGELYSITTSVYVKDFFEVY